MPTEFSFSLTDDPGALAEIAEVLGQAGVNIDGGSGTGASGTGVIRLVTNDVEATCSALTKRAIDYKSQEVLLIRLQDSPGMLGKLTRAFAEEGVNLTSFYVTLEGKQVIGADDIVGAKRVIDRFGVL